MPKLTFLYFSRIRIYVLALVPTIPTLLQPSQMWDGTIIDFAINQKNFVGLQYWFFMSSWEVQYFLIVLQSWIAELFSVTFQTVNFLTVFFSMALLIREIEKISSSIFMVNATNTRFSGLIVSIFPIWHVLLSSVMTIHLISLSIGLWALRSIFESKNKQSRILYFSVLLVSYQLNSLLVLLPILAFAREVKIKSSLRKNDFYKSKALMILILAIAYYIFRQIFNRPEGIYVGYNSILNPISIYGLKSIFFSIAGYSTFLFVPLVSLFLILTRIRPVRKQANYSSLNKNIWILLVIYIASVLPYVLVGKSTSIYELGDWSQRQAITLVVSTSILLAYIFSFFEKSSQLLKHKYINLRNFVIFIYAMMLVFGIYSKFNRLVFEQKISDYVTKNNINIAPESLVQIVLSNPIVPEYRDYEASYLLFKITKESKRYVRISDEVTTSFMIPDYHEKDLVPALAYNFELFVPKCSQIIYFDIKYKFMVPRFQEYSPIESINLIKNNLKCEPVVKP